MRRHGALLAVVVTGVALRIALLSSYEPAILTFTDTRDYVQAATGPLFRVDDVRPVGYSLVLRALHAISPTLTFVVVVQHLLGLASAVLAYATVRRLGWPRWVALAPAAVLALSPDFLYFEHSLLTESVFTFTLLVVLYATTRALQAGQDEGRQRRAVGWPTLAGALLGVAVTLRTVGAFVLPVVLLALLLQRGVAGRRRLASCALVVAGAAAVVATYSAARHASTGSYAFSAAGGWALYGRAAPFADCRRFDPPARAAQLCESTDPERRYGGDFYAWHPESPAQKLLGRPPSHDRTVGAFALAAVRAQPLDYVRRVTRDLWRYVDDDAGPPPRYSGYDQGDLDLDQRLASIEEYNRTVVEPYYGSYRTSVGRGAEVLTTLQHVLRVHGALILASVVVGLLALLVSRGDRRLHVVLFLGTGIVVPFAPVATAMYNWRYIVPVLPAIVTAGAMGTSMLSERLREQRDRRAADDGSLRLVLSEQRPVDEHVVDQLPA